MERTVLSLILVVGITPVLHAQPKGEAPTSDELKGNLRVYLETGGHAQPIFYAAFTKDDKQLVTVGKDGSVQVWDVATGQRLKKILLPLATEYRAAALDPDGRNLAVFARGINNEKLKYANVSCLLFVNLDDGHIAHFRTPLLINSLAFSPTGDQLAGCQDRTLSIWDLPEEVRGKLADINQTELKELFSMRRDYSTKQQNIWLQVLKYSPDGKHVVVSSRNPPYNTAVKPALIYAAATGEEKKDPVVLDKKPIVYSFDWRPDSRSVFGPVGQGIHEWDLQGTHKAEYKLKPGQTYKLSWLRGVSTGVRRDANSTVVRLLDEDTLLLAGSGTVPGGKDLVCYVGAATLDLKSGTYRPLFQEGDLGNYLSLSVVSHDGKLGLTTVNAGRDLLFWQTKDGKAIRRIESQAQTPVRVGWLKDKTRHVLAWGLGTDPLREDFGKLSRAFDLEKLEFVNEKDFKPEEYSGRLYELGGWTFVRRTGSLNDSAWHWQGKPVTGSLSAGVLSAFTLVPTAREPIFARSTGDRVEIDKVSFGKVKPSSLEELFGKDLKPGFSPFCGFKPGLGHFDNPIRTVFVYVHDLAPWVDGHYLAIATGTQQIAVLNIKTGEKILNLYFAGQDWIAWTDSGHYAASPGGEKLMGWVVSDSLNAPATFHPASRFRKQFYRPDVIARLLKEGSFEKALTAANAEIKAQGGTAQTEVKLEKVLPPTGFIAKVDASKLPKITVQVQAASAQDNDAITKLELLADGKALFGTDGVKVLGKPQQAVTDTFAVELPPGKYKLTVRIHSQKTWSISSEAHATYAPAASAALPKAKLHVLAVGASVYKNHPGLDLPSPANDAKEIAAVLPKQCGPPLFAPGMNTTLIGPQATSTNVYQAIKDLSKQVKPEDVAVIYFGGHGLKAPSGGLYLLTHDTDMKDLDKTALSGKVLRDELSKVECRGVILILDACHSGSIGPKAKPVVDDLTRELTDDDCGVVVWCSAMGHEKAQVDSKSGHGLFTLSLLKALDAKEGAPPSKYDGKVYLNGIQNFVFEEVLHFGGQRQHPSLNIPWTVEAFPLRAVK